MSKLIARWPAIAAVVVVAQIVVAFTLKNGSAPLIYAVFCYFILIFLATGAAVFNAAKTVKASRIFWSFVAFSYGLLWLINWLWLYYVVVLHRENPFGWFHYTVFFLRPVPLMVAATTYPHWKQSRKVLYRSTLNLVLLLSSWVFVYAYFVFSYWFLDPSVFFRQYDILYGAENLFLVALLAILVLNSRPPWRTLYLHLFGASCLWAISLQVQNFAFRAGYRLGGLPDVPAVAACCWLVWVPLLGMRLSPKLVETMQPVATPRKYLSLSAMLVVLTIPVIGVWEEFHASTILEMHRFRITTVLVAFVFSAFAFYAKEQVANRELVDDIAANLRSSEERFYKAFDSNPEGITITTLSGGRYIEVNDAYLKMTGYLRSELMGSAAPELKVWCDPQERNRLVDQLIRKERVRGVQASLRTKAGEVREVEISADSIQLQGESCMIAITRDVTRNKCLEQQLLQSQKMEALGRLAGGVAHDFNNLLGVILGYNELLAKELVSYPALCKRVEAIKSACERAASLTGKLLAFSRRQILQLKVMNLNSLVSECGEMLERLLGEDIRQSIELDPALGQVKADPGQIVQVIMNLAVNARDAMPAGGMLTIGTTNVLIKEDALENGVPVPPGRYVMLAVRDTGEGMDRTTRSHIFEPFFTTKPVGQGTGLGLAIVSGIIEQSNGHILVESEPGKGTTFKIYLPRVDEAEKRQVVNKSQPQTATGSETVLLVEDDSELRDLLSEGLRADGYSVLVATNGAEALRAADQYPDSIEALITDVIMPEMSGPELARLLSLRRPQTKVLFISGYTDDKLGHAPLSELDGILFQKPFSLTQLTEKLREVLRHGIPTVHPTNPAFDNTQLRHNC